MAVGKTLGECVQILDDLTRCTEKPEYGYQAEIASSRWRTQLNRLNSISSDLGIVGGAQAALNEICLQRASTADCIHMYNLLISLQIDLFRTSDWIVNGPSAMNEPTGDVTAEDLAEIDDEDVDEGLSEGHLVHKLWEKYELIEEVIDDLVRLTTRILGTSTREGRAVQI